MLILNAGGVETGGKQSADSCWVKGEPLFEKELDFVLSENLSATMTVCFHLFIIPHNSLFYSIELGLERANDTFKL
ncbi:MAG: hypothetical protein AAF298_29770 [Cyanobacteria bacterium P01_A01_bin.40]